VLVAWFIQSLVTLDPKEVLQRGFDAAALKLNRGH
jgi:hypothetical protein